jgi:hypothetical protein
MDSPSSTLMARNSEKAIFLFSSARTSIYTFWEILGFMVMSLACQILVAIGARGACC